MATVKIGDNVLISEGITPQGGRLLIADTSSGVQSRRLFMDVRKEMIPDGQTAYFFGNKVLVTVHWSQFSQEDAEQCKGNIKIAAGLNYKESGIFMFVKFGNYQWGDVLVEPDLLWCFNDANKGFDEISFLFVDSDTGELKMMRSFPINGDFQRFFAIGNHMSYEFFANSGMKKPRYSSVRDLYDDWSQASMGTRLWLLKEDPEEMNHRSGVVTAEVDCHDQIHWSINN